MQEIPLITEVIVVPDRINDPNNFPTKVNAYLAQTPTVVNQKNAMAQAMNAVSLEMTALAQTMSDDAETAVAQAALATSMALSAVNSPGTNATSATSLTIGTGPATMTIQAGKSIVRGMSVKVAATTSPGRWMHGDVTAYDDVTGELTVQVDTIHNSGTYDAWTISLAPPEIDGALNDGRVQEITSEATTIIDLSLGHVIVLSQTVDITELNFTNTPLACEVIIKRIGAGAAGINWISAGVVVFPAVTLDAFGENTFSLVTTDSGLSWSANSQFARLGLRGLAVAHGTSPYITIYDHAIAKITNPGTLPTGTASGCAFSPDGSKLAVAHGTSPFITIYNTLDWSKIANPGTLPTGTAGACAFSPDGSKLAVVHGTSPYLTIYNTSDWSKIANPGTLPTGTANGCAFSPDGSKLAVAYGTSPYLTIYNTSDWSKITDPGDPGTLSAANAYICAFSPDGSKLAVTHILSPFIAIYNTSDWSKIANPGTLPTATAYACAFSSDGSKLAVAYTASPYLIIYNTSDWSKIANPGTLPAGTGIDCAFSPIDIED